LSCRPASIVQRLHFSAWLVFLIFTFSTAAVNAGDKTAASRDATEAWLVTYAPGEVYYERFGHNALWLKNPGSGIDHIFNFGFFDFNQPNFLSRFLRGDTLYFSAARKPEIEFAEYRASGRSIKLQKLNLDAAQYQQLEQYLIAQVQPGKRDYRYEYFRNNCSTRVRDALDLVLNQQLYHSLGSQSANVTLRQQIHTASSADPWLYLGMDLAMGPGLDQPQSLWQAAFIPEILSQSVADMTGLVASESAYYQSGNILAEDSPLQYLLVAGFGFAVLFILITRPWRKQALSSASRILVFSWLGLCALGGIFLLWLWLATSHVDAAGNWNVLLLNPLYLPAIFWLKSKSDGLRWLSVLVSISTVTAVMGGWWNGQDMNAPLVFFTPVMLLLATLLWRGENTEGVYSQPANR